jgi:hypothetical protein
MLDGRALPDLAADFACGIASVVVALDPGSALRAMAWGSPLVTTPSTAAVLRLDNGVHALIADSGDARAVEAGQVARDMYLAARLSAEARRLFERRNSVRFSAMDLLLQLGLVGTSDPRIRTQRRLDALGTPPDAASRRRALRSMAGLSGRGAA